MKATAIISWRAPRLSGRTNCSALSMPTSPGLGHDDEQPGGDIKADADVITANKSIAGRNAHSVAADPNTNQVYVPIPAGVSTICSSKGGTDCERLHRRLQNPERR